LLVAFTLAEDANVVDVGAHEGAFIAEVLAIAPRGHHIAYEPLPEPAQSLTRRFPSLDVRKSALSDSEGTSSFVWVVDAPAMSGFRRRTYPGHPRTQEIEVNSTTLDLDLPDGYVPALVKIDVEGAELQVLRGARETLRRHRPTIAFEHGIGGADHYGTRPADVFSLLVDDLGYRIYDIDGVGPYTLDAFESMFHRPDLWNFVAVSSGRR
jgi:FkbM family methyltransferase